MDVHAVKIGVALSGCDLGGISAWVALRELEARGLDIGMISACCLPSAAALPYAHGCSELEIYKLSSSFLSDARESDIDFAVANLSAVYRKGKGKRIPLAINAVNVYDGNIVTFTDDYSITGHNLKTFGLEDPYDTLSATMSLMDGLGSYRYKDQKLCDFCCWYGCPSHPLTLAGYKKIISLAFLPQLPQNPYEVLVKHTVASSASSVSMHIPIEFARRDFSFAEYAEITAAKIAEFEKEILFETLF